MRRGGRARRAMLGAVATGALLGAAQGFNLGWKSLLASATAQSDGEAGGYTGRAVSVSSWGNRLAVGEAKADESKSQVSAEMSPVHRRRLAARRLAQQGTDYPTIDFNPNADTDNPFDGTYKVVTASGLEIDIDSTSDTGVYTIAPFGPSTSGGFPTIEVAGGDLSACTSDITLNLNAGKITCTVAGSQAGNTTYTTLMINGESSEEFDLQVSDCVGDGLNLFVDESAGKITCEVDTAVAGTPQTYPAGLTGDTLSSLNGDLVSVSDCKDGAITLIGDGKTGGITCQVNVQVAGGSVETATATFTVTESSGDSAPPVDLSTCTAVTVDGDEIACGETVYTTYAAVAPASDGSPFGVYLSTCDGGITLNLDEGQITCTVAGTQDTETEVDAEVIVVTEVNEVTTIARAGTELASAGGDFIIELDVNGSVTASAVDASPSPTASPAAAAAARPPCRTSPSPCRTPPSPCRTSPSPTRTSRAAAARRPRPPRRRRCPAR